MSNSRYSFALVVLFVFIHGCVHLKGFDHGDKMEKVEEKFRKIFKV